MFSKTRPVPSRAALERLYQLAYISSGTAVGLATLCAEERRRRTNHLQTIADNAKRLRQSPKHVNNIGRPARAREDGQTIDESAANIKTRHLVQVESSGLDGRSVRAPELPSFVDVAYSQLAVSERDRHKGPRKRPEHWDKTGDGRSTERALGKISQKGSISTSRTREQNQAFRNKNAHTTRAKHERLLSPDHKIDVYPPISSSSSQKRTPQEKPMLATHSRSNIELERKHKHKPLPDQTAQVLDSVAQSVKFDSSTESIFKLINPETSQERSTATANFPRHVGMTDAGQQHEPYAALEEDESLLRVAQAVDPASKAAEAVMVSGEQVVESRVGRSALGDVLQSGTLDEIQKLTLQVLQTRSLSEAELGHICKSWPHVAELGSATEVTDFYARVLSGLEPAEQLQCFLDIASKSLAMIFKSSAKTAAEQHLFSKLATIINSCGDTKLDSAVERLCQRYLSQGKPRRAYHIVEAALLAVKSNAKSALTWISLQLRIAASLLEHDNVTFCAKVVASCIKLQWKAIPTGLFKDLLSVCQLRQSYSALWPVAQALAHSPDSRAFISRMSGSEKITLAAACWQNAGSEFTSAQRNKLYSDLIGALPETDRDAADAKLTCDRMWEIWRTQRNSTNVWKYYKSAKIRRGEEYANVAAFGDMELALVQIMNEANRPERGLAILADVFKGGLRDARALTLIAVTLAHQKAWQQLDSLLVMIKDSGRFQNSQAVARNVRNIIKIYSKEHTAAQTWRFATGLIVDLGWVPDQTTNTAILQSFVTNHALDFIPQWIRHLRVLGFHFEMNASVIIKLLRRYYHEQLPPNTLLVGYCKNLAMHWPGGIDEKKFESIIKASAGYDFRRARGQNKSLIREHATRNLAKLGCESGGIDAFWRHVSTTESQNHDLNASVISNGNIHASDAFAEYAPVKGHAAHRQNEESSVSRKNAVEREMNLALSLQNYAKVMDLYYENLPPSRLPPSTLVLELAIEASARKAGGDLREASRILADASSAGMDTRRAMDAYMVQKIYGMSATERKDIVRLQNTVLEYYRTNSANRFPARHHVGTTAADVLINNRLARHAIKLLNTIYSSSWVPKDSLDIATLTVYLKAYTAQRNHSGVRWVVRKVLRSDTTIDRIFVDTLRDCARDFKISAYRDGTNRRGRLSRDFTREMKYWQFVVSARRHEQRVLVNRFGKQLVKTILSCGRQQLLPELPSEMRMDLEQDLIGVSEVAYQERSQSRVGEVEEPEALVPQEDAIQNTPDRRAALRRARGRLTPSINFPSNFSAGGKRMPRMIQNREWLKRYRLFLRRTLIMPDGKAAAFRLYVN